jgi:protease IV
VVTKVATSLMATVFVSSILLNVYFAIILSQQVSMGPVVEQTHQEGETPERIVILPVMGVITDDTSAFVYQAMKALEDDPPAALVLRVNSGGGTVGASDRIWHQLDSFKSRHPNVKIVASYGSYAASGGYYVSALADHIYAEPTCITGSIGVMGQLFTVEGLLEKIGVEPVTMIASGSPNKDTANDITRAWTDQDRAVVQTLLDSAYDRFLEVVVAGRAKVLSEEEVRALATGKVFTAPQALEAKLIDSIGYLDDAINEAAKLAGLPPDKVRVTIIASKPSLMQAIMGVKTDMPALSTEQVRSALLDLGVPRISYSLTTP